MKTAAISRFVIVAAIAALVVVGGSATAWAQCPVSPSYTTDFTSEVTSPCLTLNGVAAIGAPASTLVPPAGTTNPAQPVPGVSNVLRLTPTATFQTGSAWFNTAQPVANPFSTTFMFQLSNTSNQNIADGFAFVIQNSTNPTHALDPDVNGTDGCSLGFGDAPDGTCTGTTGGITNSVAVEFDTYNNGNDIGDPNANHVAIQSCGTAANSVEGSVNGVPLPGSCRITDNPNPLNGLQQPVTLADGNFHTVTISFAPLPGGTCTSGSCPGFLHVILDSNDLFPSGVSFDIGKIGLTNGTAFVGFTGATGGGTDLHDILSWTFTPQTQSAVLTAGGASTPLPFSGGPNTTTNGFEYDLQLNATGNGNTNPAAVAGSVTALVMDQKSCNKLVQKSFPLTQCFVFQNADGKGHSGAVLFSLTCPGFNGSVSSTCGDSNLNDFAAALGTTFIFQKSQNPAFQLLNATIGPYPGWLKGDGGVSGFPCTPNPDGVTPLFKSNQISFFSVSGDPLGTTKGKSGGSGSCWVATYATTGELPPGISVAAPTFKTYKQSLTPGVATYTCSNPVTSFKDPTGATGPYLAVNSCSQSQSPNPNNLGQNPGCVLGSQCSGGFDLTKTGLHAFTVTSKDTGGNVNAFVVIYNVTK